jgi:arylsulfatase A-like enzyme
MPLAATETPTLFRGSGRRWVRSLWAATLAIVLFACTSPERPNIVLITVDTLRADRLTPYGYEAIQTPAIAALADDGIVFEKAFADTSWTLPSLSSVMTGKYPTRHRVRTWNDKLRPEHDTLAEILKNQGYRTAAIVGSYPLDRYFGLDQGFDHYDDTMTVGLYEGDTPPATSPEFAPPTSPEEREIWQLNRERHNAYRTDGQVADAAIHWLGENPARPFFLWVHFFGPHEKGKRQGLDPEAVEAHIQKQIDRYDSDVAEMDREVGRFLDALREDPRFATTAIVFHSDHGQSLNEHGLFGHGFDLYDPSVKVPLLVRLPGGDRAGQRVPHIVRNLDIFATVLDIARADGETWDSRTLFAPPAADGNHVYMETYHTVGLTQREVEINGRRRKVGSILRGVRTDRRKLIAHEPALGPTEDPGDPLPPEYIASDAVVKLFLFDFEGDPNEHRNLVAQRKNQTAHLHGLLRSHEDEGTDSAADPAGLDEAAKERLRSLGYQP